MQASGGKQEKRAVKSRRTVVGYDGSPDGPSTTEKPEEIDEALRSAGGVRSSTDPPRSVALTDDDRLANFTTTIQNYVLTHTEDGVWRYEDRGQPRRLTLRGVAEQKLERAGEDLYFGSADFDEAGGRRVRLRFLVDFSGAEWRVASVERPAAKKAAPHRP